MSITKEVVQIFKSLTRLPKTTGKLSSQVDKESNLTQRFLRKRSPKLRTKPKMGSKILTKMHLSKVILLTELRCIRKMEKVPLNL